MTAQAGRASAGVVLVGGRSSRMGTPKAALEWHGSTLLYRTLGVLRRAIDGPLLVVRAAGQRLPDIPPRVRVVEDVQEGLGPLQGIATALTELAGGVGTDEARAAFICATDLPFLHPAFVRRVAAALADDVDVVLPVARGYPQPLAATYRVDLSALVTDLVAAGELRLRRLFREHRCRTLRLDEKALFADPTLATVDPALDSVINVNSPDEYRVARRHPAPAITVRRHGALASGGHHGPRTVRAATLVGAAEVVGLALGQRVVATLNGGRIDSGQIGWDGDVPLVNGDAVDFFPVAVGE